MESIEKLVIFKQYQKQETIAFQGEKWPYLLLVHQGSLEAIKDSAEGRTYIATTFNPGDVFWGVSFFDDRHLMPATLIARENLKLYLWHRDDLLPYLLQEGKASWELARLTINRLLMAGEKVGEMTFQPVAVRLAKLLLLHSKDEIQRPIERDLTLDEMAARIGSTREMVCRFLHKFSDEGLIDITRTEYTIKDSETLKLIASK